MLKQAFNKASIIDNFKRKELIEKDSNTAKIIRPILRGRDIKRYGYDFADLWLINTHNGIKETGVRPVNIEDYPAIKKHLDSFWIGIEKRADQGDTPYNLRNCAYMDDFSKQKIVWARLMRISKTDSNSFPRFALIPDSLSVLDSLCFFVGTNLQYLQAILNSEFGAYYFFNNIAILDNGGMQMRQQYIENMPIPKCSIDTQKLIEELVLKVNPNLVDGSFERTIDNLIYDAFGFKDEEIQVIREYLSRKYQEIHNNI